MGDKKGGMRRKVIRARIDESKSLNPSNPGHNLDTISKQGGGGLGARESLKYYFKNL